MKKAFLTATMALISINVLSYDLLVDGIYYGIDSSNGSELYVTCRSNNDYGGNVTIPSTVIYNGRTYKVTSIGRSAFYGCRFLDSVTIPESITSIDGSAFYGCSGLTSITIPNSVTSIGDEAFEGCVKLTSVHISDIAAWCKISFVKSGSSRTTCNPLYFAGHLYLNGEEVIKIEIPNGVTNIGDYAFVNCKMTSVTFPETVTNIGKEAFWCSSLTSVTIPNSVTSIGERAFSSCI